MVLVKPNGTGEIRTLQPNPIINPNRGLLSAFRHSGGLFRGSDWVPRGVLVASAGIMTVPYERYAQSALPQFGNHAAICT
jgi:hypothetical protein